MYPAWPCEERTKIEIVLAMPDTPPLNEAAEGVMGVNYRGKYDRFAVFLVSATSMTKRKMSVQSLCLAVFRAPGSLPASIFPPVAKSMRRRALKNVRLGASGTSGVVFSSGRIVIILFEGICDSQQNQTWLPAVRTNWQGG